MGFICEQLDAALPALRLTGLAPSAVRDGHRRGDQVVDQPTQERGERPSVHLGPPGQRRLEVADADGPETLGHPAALRGELEQRDPAIVGSLDRRTAPASSSTRTWRLTAPRSIAAAEASPAIGSRPLRSSVRRSAAPCCETSTLAAEVTRDVACRLARSRPRRWSDAVSSSSASGLGTSAPYRGT